MYKREKILNMYQGSFTSCLFIPIKIIKHFLSQYFFIHVYNYLVDKVRTSEPFRVHDFQYSSVCKNLYWSIK